MSIYLKLWCLFKSTSNFRQFAYFPKQSPTARSKKTSALFNTSIHCQLHQTSEPFSQPIKTPYFVPYAELIFSKKRYLNFCLCVISLLLLSFPFLILSSFCFCYFSNAYFCPVFLFPFILHLLIYFLEKKI